VEPVLAWLEGSPLGYAIRNSGVWTYAILNLTHILGISSLFGALLTLDLRLIGVWRHVPIAAIARPVVPIATTAFLVAVSSGICMLATNGTEYIGNPFLPIKFTAIGAGLANVAIVNRIPGWRFRDTAPITPRDERWLAAAGATSLLCWLTAVGAGRMIGYW
jgi:hypothetical protein